jgi:hypothetical protein
MSSSSLRLLSCDERITVRAFMYARCFVMSRRQDGHVGVGAVFSHSRMQPLWKACEQPGKTVTPPAATRSSMQIMHCAAAAASRDRSSISAPLWPVSAKRCDAAAIAQIELEMVAWPLGRRQGWHICSPSILDGIGLLED